MEFQDIANLVNRVAIEQKGRPLKDVERLVLKGAWHGQTYGDMAREAGGYTEDYLKKDVGPKLWHLLSDLIDYQDIKVTKRNIQNVLQHWAIHCLEQELTTNETAAPLAAQGLSPASPEGDWGSAALEVWSSPQFDISDCVNRPQELTQLQHWLQEAGCRAILLWGLPGVGKTTLISQLLENLPDVPFFVGYLKLRPGATDEAFLTAVMAWLLSTGQTVPTSSIEPWTWLVQQFGQRRYLLVVDQLEALFQPGQPPGTFSPETRNIEQFFQGVAAQLHQSLVVWVSREKPLDLSQMRGGQMREYQLNDLTFAEAQTLLQQRGIQATSPDWQTLLDRYGGNPLLLKGMAATVQEVYQGQVASFLSGSDPVIPGLFREGIEQILVRLTDDEYYILFRLAQAQEPITIDALATSMVPPPNATALQSLLGRGVCYPVSSPSEGTTCFDLTPIIRSIVLEQLRSRLLEELKSNHLNLFNRLPLVVATACEGVQERQRQILLYPLIEALQRQYPTESGIMEKCQHIYQSLRQGNLGATGYGTGNYIHLCDSLGISLSGVNFADLSIWQSDLRHINLQGADFRRARFADTIFATALGRNPVIAFSQNGEYLATGDQEGRLLLWEPHQGKLLKVLDDGLGQGIRAIAFSPGTELLAVSTDSGRIWLWSLSESYRPDGLFNHPVTVVSLSFSPDGSLLASGDEEGQVFLWDIASGEAQGRWHYHQRAVRSLSFDPQGQTLVSSGDDQQAYVWRLDQSDWVKEFQAGPTAQIRTVGFLADPQWPESPPRAVAAGYDEQSLTLWDMETGRAYWAVPSDGRAILTMALDGRGQSLICSYQDFSVDLWNLPRRERQFRLSGFKAPVWTMVFSPNGQWFATGGDYIVKLWDTTSGACLRRFIGQAQPVRCLALTPAGNTLLTGHEDHSLRLWQWSTAKSTICPGQLVGHTAAVQAIAVSCDSQWWASSASDFTIRLWQSNNQHSERIIAPLESTAHTLAFSFDSRILASAGEETTIALWDTATGKQLNSLEGHESPASCLLFSADDKILVSGGRDGDLRVWEVTQGSSRILPGHQGRVHSLTLSRDGRLLASASYDGGLRWWALPQGDLLGQWHHPQGHWLQAVTLGPENEILAITSQAHQVEVWDVQAQRCRHQLEGHRHDIWQIVVSWDRTTLATASQDDEIRIWRLDSGTCLQVLHPDRPYEGVNILGAEGLSEPEIKMLRALGAIERYGD